MSNPLHRLLDFFEQARRASDPCATFVTLVTVDHVGMPVSRIITVREITGDGLVASISATSPKVAQLAADRWEVLCFWPSLMVQCRLRGHAHIQHDEATVASWRTRPKSSRLVDTYHASARAQSSPIASRETLLEEVDALARTSGDLTQCPETVTTLLLNPTRMEIWIGSVKDRLHDRREYTLSPTGWTEQVLVP
jgi:pyridoxamine 5'-phosphate oxidase